MPTSRTVWVAHTDVGRSRDNNEDRFYVTPEGFDPSKVERLGRLFIVADGMGGYEAGEVAAQIAVDTIVSGYYASTGTIEDGLKRAIVQAQEAITAEQVRDAKHAAMGCALVLAVVMGNRLVVANVGDCRAYLLRGGALKQVSTDHSWVAERVRAGVIDPADAEHHPMRSALVRAMGQKDASSEPDLKETDWLSGDRLLICSDGLWDSLTGEQIQQHLSGPFADSAKTIVSEANRLGGRDNITAVIVAEQAEQPVPAARPPGRRSGGFASVVGIGLLAVTVGALITLVVGGLEMLGGAKATTPSPNAPTATVARATVTPFAATVGQAQATVEATLPALPTPTLSAAALGRGTASPSRAPLPTARPIPGTSAALCHTSEFSGKACSGDFRDGLSGDQTRIYASWSPTLTQAVDFTIKWYKENERSKVMEEIQRYACTWPADAKLHTCKMIAGSPAAPDFATGSYTFVDNGDRSGSGVSPIWRVPGFPGGRYRFELLPVSRQQVLVDFAIVK